MQPIYPVPAPCFLSIPYPSIGSQGMLTPQSVLWCYGTWAGTWADQFGCLIPGLRYHPHTPYSSTPFGSVWIGMGGPVRTWFGDRNGWSPDITPPSRVLCHQ